MGGREAEKGNWKRIGKELGNWKRIGKLEGLESLNSWCSASFQTAFPYAGHLLPVLMVLLTKPTQA